MTEARVAYQTAFVGLASDQVAGDIVDRCRAMLLEEPETREDYKLAYVRYLIRYCGLGSLLAQRPDAEVFQRWYMTRGVPDYRTVANRCQELMRADAKLQPAPDVMEVRQRQRRQGVVR